MALQVVFTLLREEIPRGIESRSSILSTTSLVAPFLTQEREDYDKVVFTLLREAFISQERDDYFSIIHATGSRLLAWHIDWSVPAGRTYLPLLTQPKMLYLKPEMSRRTAIFDSGTQPWLPFSISIGRQTDL